MRLLIVDDDAVFRQELGDLLDQDGHTSTIVPSVPKALVALESEDFDLVLSDLKMPRHSGLELLSEVRRRWPRTLVVVITGYASVDTAVEAMKAGAFDYVRKPFQLDQIHKVLALAVQEVQFQGRSGNPRTVDGIARQWVEEGISVLHVSDRPLRPSSHVAVVPVPPTAELVRDRVESFLAENSSPGVILEGVDGLFHEQRHGEFTRFIAGLRDRLDGKGPLVVTFDPGRLSVAEAGELHSTLSGALTRSTLEALSNPIRRAVLQRAGVGPISFSQALDAAGLDDSPKLSFHLRRLQDDGLLLHQEDRYKISDRGRDSLRLLAEWDAMGSAGRTSSAAIPLSRS